MASVTELYPQPLMEDLANSGLLPSDVRARVAGANEKQATNTPLGVDAYVLPYHDLNGKVIPFYRLKLLNSPDPDIKYKQLVASGNHLYFPPGLDKLLRHAKYILLTEGEKKAAAAVKAGFPCVALGGVESWRNRTLTFSKDTQVGESKSGALVLKIPAGSEAKEETDSLATGLKEVIQLSMKNDIPIIIVYDSDFVYGANTKEPVRFEVQRAAATLGFELRANGVSFNNIRQLVLLPEDPLPEGTKLGLDDYLLNDSLGPDMLHQAIHDNMRQRTAFPRHPNVRGYVNKKLAKTHISRNDMNALSTAITCDLDINGMRLHCTDDDNMYYFDEKTHKLLKVHFTQYMDFAKTSFGRKLYDTYGITQGDQRLIQVLNSQFCGEEPIQKVRPEKIMTVRGDTLYYQISDGRMVKVDASGIRIMQNGGDEVLFEGEMVEEIDHTELSKALAQLSGKRPKNLWYEVLKQSRIESSPDDRSRKLLSYLYSLSPWMYRWRGTQLPLEQMLGEAGSGKSTLYKLRQLIISGSSYLRNAPKDLKDWTASIASSGSLHVTDNVHMSGGVLKQQLSDELCRVITEDEPFIESRKLYTDNDLIRVPVRCVFAVTAIKQPFTNTDIIQRSIIAQLDKGTEVIEYDASWVENQIEKHGGRVMMVAQQLHFIHHLFVHIKKTWDLRYRARFRLINIEQLLVKTAEVYGEDPSWVAGYLEKTRDTITANTDSALEGLLSFAENLRAKNPPKKWDTIIFTSREMAEWFASEEEWELNTVLVNARKLGHYIEEKKNTIAHIAGIAPTGAKRNNYKTYKLIPVSD
jgi:hypothetical protein